MHCYLRRLGLAMMLTVAVLCSWSLRAEAQTSYKYQVTPYFFFSGVNGTIGEQGRTAQVDASFGDVISHLDGVATIYFDARFGRWRALFDNMYVDVSNARATPGPLFDSVAVAARMWMVNPQVGYALFQKEDKELDVTAGARIWNVENKVTLFRGGFQADFGTGNHPIADPIIGTRFYSNLSPKIFVLGKADIGGFDAAASMDWQAWGEGGYAFNERVAVSAGYRYISVDYTPNNAIFKISMRGVIAGLGIRF